MSNTCLSELSFVQIVIRSKKYKGPLINSGDQSWIFTQISWVVLNPAVVYQTVVFYLRRNWLWKSFGEMSHFVFCSQTCCYKKGKCRSLATFGKRGRNAPRAVSGCQLEQSGLAGINQVDTFREISRQKSSNHLDPQSKHLASSSEQKLCSPSILFSRLKKRPNDECPVHLDWHQRYSSQFKNQEYADFKILNLC